MVPHSDLLGPENVVIFFIILPMSKLVRTCHPHRASYTQNGSLTPMTRKGDL